ncbi:cilia- and flagella-associated protein 206 isoform X2 [Antennarius striatus]|uniref:cilia- and flagella-associated protein 206 isoform X2 n=1 Tax=Antennarius striatus TaxID=241820 RepID=UPI0035B1BA81
MSRSPPESLMTELDGEVTRLCAARGHALPDATVACMVKSVLLDPRNGCHAEGPLTMKDVEELQERCLHELREECSLTLDTIKMQLYFNMNYTSRPEFLDRIQQETERKLSPLRTEITDTWGKTSKELNDLYRKIITYILLSSGMGSPTDVKAEGEAAAALRSIFPLTGLVGFMVLLNRDKELQLHELDSIVTGIRLFNSARRKRGEEVNLWHLVPGHEDLPLISKEIESELTASQCLVWRYTALLERLTVGDSLPGECDVSIVLLKLALYNVRQHEAFLKRLLVEAHLCCKHIETLQTQFLPHMNFLKGAMKSKSAVYTEEVFPWFKVLSKLWSGLHSEAERLDILNNIRINLQSFIAYQDKVFSKAHLDGLLEASEVKTDEQRMAQSSEERIVPAEMKPQEWLLPETMALFNEVQLQFNGACGYTLVKRGGLLLPGNPHIGVLKHKDKFYVFSSKDAAVKFAESPDDFIAEVEEKAKLSPELIQLLNLHQQPRWMQPEESALMKPTTKCESCTQTDIHPIETNIVESYEWNEWELRRKAIKLANIRVKMTHSTQTDLSYMRRENDTQTWLPKDAACQTKRDGETTMPKPLVYVSGLRGRREGPVVKTVLTRSIDE